MPSASFNAGVQFWQDVTRSSLSAPRGDEGEFATLIPIDGDPYLRVQRTEEGPRIHLDLHVDSIPDARERAQQLGATLIADLGHAIMASPNGLTFCFVGHHGESHIPLPGPADLEQRLDQVCIDIPADSFASECEFWHQLSGWELNHSRLHEFASLTQPSDIPLRILFQKLGADDGGQTARAHLDIACGQSVDAVRAAHESLGAEFVHGGIVWTTMRDPGGMLYCLTQCDPHSGLITD